MTKRSRGQTEGKRIADLDTHVIDEWLKAHDRIQQVYGGQDAWLLHFMQTNLTALSKGDLSNLRYEFLVWVGTSWTGGRHVAPEHDPDHHPTVDMLIPLQTVAHSYVKQFMEEEEVVFHKITMTPWIWRHKPDEKERSPSGREYRTHTAGKITHGEVIQGHLNIFRYACYRSLCGLGERLKQCPECQRYFVADQRSDKTYCSATCQSRAGTKRYRSRARRRKGRIIDPR